MLTIMVVAGVVVVVVVAVSSRSTDPIAVGLHHDVIDLFE